MGRAALNWSRADLAKEAGVGVATVVRFESGVSVQDENIAAMKAAMEKRRVKFIEDGPLKGAVYGGMKKAP